MGYLDQLDEGKIPLCDDSNRSSKIRSEHMKGKVMPYFFSFYVARESNVNLGLSQLKLLLSCWQLIHLWLVHFQDNLSVFWSPSTYGTGRVSHQQACNIELNFQKSIRLVKCISLPGFFFSLGLVWYTGMSFFIVHTKPSD